MVEILVVVEGLVVEAEVEEVELLVGTIPGAVEAGATEVVIAVVMVVVGGIHKLLEQPQ